MTVDRLTYGDNQANKGLDTFLKTCEQQSYLFKVVSVPKDRYSVYDLALTIKDQPTIGEIKVRTKEFPTYMLELSKLENLHKVKDLVKEKKGKDVRLVYINILPNNKTAIWDVTELELKDFKIDSKLLPKNDYDYQSNLIEKKVIYLKTEDAMIIKTDNTK